MVQQLVMTLERHAGTMWLVFLGRMIGHFLKAVSDVIASYRAFIHFATTSILASFALTLAMPPSTFASSASYGWFRQTWPHTEHAWAMLLLFIVIMSYSALFVKERRPMPVATASIGRLKFNKATPAEAYHLFCVGLLFSAHTEIAWCFFKANPAGTGFRTFTAIALISLWLAYHIHKFRGIWEPPIDPRT